MEHILTRFADQPLGRRIMARLAQRSGPRLTVMEVCGTHTMAIARMAIRKQLASQLDLRSGPGCPVCVTSTSDLDRMLALARLPGVMIATFGDMLRVPGSFTSLVEEQARGAAVRMVYSPLDAVRLAREYPDREVVFFAVGFETTTPATALALQQAIAVGLTNFSIFSCNKLTPPAVAALLHDGEALLDGLLCPGHVSAVIGRAAWDFVAVDYRLPAVVAGFEPLDILAALDALLTMIDTGGASVLNNYPRVVQEAGNTHAQLIVQQYFQHGTAEWRGLGLIPASGLQLREEYALYDAERRFPVQVPTVAPQQGCACGEVLKGKITPPECRLFDQGCNPQRPAGPCMVSSEGACAAYYQYERRVKCG